MVSETHIKYVKEPDFFFLKKNITPKMEEMGQNRVFLIYQKIWSLNFSEFVLQEKFILFAMFLHKSKLAKNLVPATLAQNEFG